MGLALSEQETVIRIGREEQEAVVYTSDTTMMTRLDKLADPENEKAPLWKLKEVHRSRSGEGVAKTYTTNKKLVSFRAGIVTRDLTEEQKAELAERMRNAQKNRK